MYESEIAEAVSAMQLHPKANNEELVSLLRAAGIAEPLAGQLVVFVPIAYCRLMLAGRITFPGSFIRRDPATQRDSKSRFGDQPVYREALAAADKAATEGVPPNDLLLVAGRSCEFHVINKMLLQREKMEDIRLTEMIIILPGEMVQTPTQRPEAIS